MFWVGVSHFIDLIPLILYDWLLGLDMIAPLYRLAVGRKKGAWRQPGCVLGTTSFRLKMMREPHHLQAPHRKITSTCVCERAIRSAPDAQTPNRPQQATDEHEWIASSLPFNAGALKIVIFPAAEAPECHLNCYRCGHPEGSGRRRPRWRSCPPALSPGQLVRAPADAAVTSPVAWKLPGCTERAFFQRHPVHVNKLREEPPEAKTTRRLGDFCGTGSLWGTCWESRHEEESKSIKDVSVSSWSKKIMYFFAIFIP